MPPFSRLFNEIDMTGILELRSRYKEQFEKKYGIKLGFMGLFIKACVEALKAFPAVNASIDGTDILYHHFYNVGVRRQHTSRTDGAGLARS